jgi:2-hydroxychromene-2-carboxylate isomerase
MAQESLTECREVEFWFDFASTYSYPAAMRVQDVAARYESTVKWKPFLLGPIFAAQGWTDSPFNLYPVKGRYMWRDLERLCAGMKIPFRKPSVFPRRSLLATRMACAIEDETWLPDFIRRVFTANFAEDQNIGDSEVLLRCLSGMTENPTAVVDAATAELGRRRARENTDRALKLGIFGAPTVVAGEELFWGNDRLEAAFAWGYSGVKSP